MNDKILTSINDISKAITYITPLPYISGNIREYDIKAANINVLLQKNVIDKDKYDYLNNLPKQYREIDVGNMMKRDISIYNTISDGIREAKFKLLSENNVNPLSIVRIANDAVYINSSVALNITQFDNIIFVMKKEYNVMINLNGVILFISLYGDNYDIDVIGINNDLVSAHEKFITFICDLVYRIERVGYKDAIDFYQDFYKKYINHELDLEYYREFNSDSCYTTIGTLRYGLWNINSLDNIDIGYNLFLLRQIWTILLQMAKLN